VASHFSLSSNVAIIGLPSSTTSWPPGTSALVSGWGKVDETSKSSPYLRGVTVQIFSEQDCKRAHGSDKITSRISGVTLDFYFGTSSKSSDLNEIFFMCYNSDLHN
jgi:hypothetical protein